MAWCLTKEQANSLKEAAKRGEINIQKLYEMSSKERNALFKKYVDSESATNVNAGFESAMVSENVNALKKWAEKTFTPGEKKTIRYKDIISKIDELKGMGVLSPEGEKQFFSDLVAQKLGATITSEEAATINKKATELGDIYKNLKDIGNPEVDQKLQLDYFKKKREMENYLDSLTPSPKLRVLTSTIARGNMLIRLPSILVNINSNNIEGGISAIVRRFEERGINGANTDLLKKNIAFQTKVYKETGYDLTRMTSLDIDKKVLGEAISTSQGPGLIRKIGRLYEDKVFGATQGLPDVIAASVAFNDRLNLMTTKLARAENLKGEALASRAREIYLDAMNVNPKTEMGNIARNNAITDALRSTNTDKRFLADRALKLRNILNVGDLRFGDLNIPFVKTTANAIQSGLETAGLTVPIEVPTRLVKMVKLVQGGEGWGSASKSAFSGFGKTMVRAGLGTTAAFLIANAIKNDDYVGIYPTSQKERELLKLRNANPNSIRIGGKWYSLDWFGPLASGIIGFLNAKKYGKDLGSYLLNFGAGAGYQALRTPGLDYLYQTIDYVNKTLTPSAKNTVDSKLKDLANYAVDFIQSRAIPGIVQEFAYLTTPNIKDTSRTQDILAPIKGSIPGLRATLPDKETIFGDKITSEGWLRIIFGGRMKTDVTSPLIEEMVRLSVSGNLPSLTDVSKTSPRAEQLRQQIGEKRFNEAMDIFQAKFKKDVERLINTASYKRLSDEKKANEVDKIKNEDFDKVLNKFGYKKPKTKAEIPAPTNQAKNFLTQLQEAIVRPVYASEKEGPTVAPQYREKDIATAKSLYQNYPDWYKQHITPDDEIKMFGKTVTDYLKGEASFYDPKDPRQTRKDTTGVGAYGREIKSGSVAFGNRMFHDQLKKGEEIYVQVKGMEGVKTPYGDGVFRIDDTMNNRYNVKGKYNIDFSRQDMAQVPSLLKSGRFPIEFKIINKSQLTNKNLSSK